MTVRSNVKALELNESGSIYTESENPVGNFSS